MEQRKCVCAKVSLCVCLFCLFLENRECVNLRDSIMFCQSRQTHFITVEQAQKPPQGGGVGWCGGVTLELHPHPSSSPPCLLLLLSGIIKHN